MAPETLDAGSLYRAHAAFVAGFLTRMGVQRGELDDLVQEVFLVAHRRGGYVPGPARPTTWLAEIAIRVVSTNRRTRRRHPESPDDDAIAAAPAAQADPARAVENAQVLARVQRALDAIALDRRAIFVLFELEGEACDAIAAGFEIPLSTVYSRLHTARREFREGYERLLAVDERPSPDFPSRVRP
jgi:RNA polymerase sigma-70 factor (ECF subfamily)